MKIIFLILILAFASPTLSLAKSKPDVSPTCHGNLTSAALNKALTDGVFDNIRLAMVEVNFIGNNLYLVIIKKNNKEVRYPVFTDYEESFSRNGKLCEITAIHEAK